MSNQSADNTQAPLLCRLIYKSNTCWDDLSNEMLVDLAKQSAENNQAMDVSGLLVLSGETFLQVLEGPSDAVNALYVKIIADPRHSSPRLLSFEPITSRQFSEWSMHVVDLYDLPIHHRSLLTAKYPMKEDYIEISDDSALNLSLLLDAKAICLSEAERDPLN
tara:strand:- start:177 stop:665 length:489 start_codon:yes stop_codon:yes gene_type:complete